MRRPMTAGIAIAIITVAMIAVPALASKCGHRIAYDRDSGSWTDTPAAAANADRVHHPRSFTVVINGNPKPSYFCTSQSKCKTIYGRWTVSCKKNGKYRTRAGNIHGQSRRLVGHPKLPFKHPGRCAISASGALAYQAGGSISVSIFYRG